MSKQPVTSNLPLPPIVASRMAGEERRLQILQVAISLFAKKGFRGTTTKEIAQAAGVSEAMVFRHFATKEELYKAILDHKACASGSLDLCHAETVTDAIARKDDRAVFEQLGLALLRHHEHDTEFLGLLMHSALEGHELAQMFWERNVLQMYDFLRSYLAERQREGAILAVDPGVIVRAFVGMIIHHSVSNSLWDRQRRLLDISNEVAAREFTEILLHGICATTAGPRAHATATRRQSGVQRDAAKKKQTK
ncbi:MAG TPA: TetR/AcrR family transcriptional regulator [Pyrinomonadaceae bacterium]